MGVNRTSTGIISDTIIREASHQEIIRRFFRCACEYAMGLVDKDTLNRAKSIMEKVNARVEERKVVSPAREAAIDAMNEGKGHNGIFCGASVQLKDGTIITGKNTPLMHSSSSLVLNAVKYLANLSDDLDLLPKNMIDSISFLKREILSRDRLSLNLDETMILLGVSALTDQNAKKATACLKNLKNCEVHLTHMPTPGDEAGLRKLQVNLTCDPQFSSQSLFASE